MRKWNINEVWGGDFPGGPVVKTLLSNMEWGWGVRV